MAKEITQRNMILRLHQAVIGIEDNPEENGLIGDVADIKKLLTPQNERIATVERSVSRIKGVGVGIGAVVALAGATIGIIQAVG